MKWFQTFPAAVLAAGLLVPADAPAVAPAAPPRTFRIAVVPFTPESAAWTAASREIHERLVAGIKTIDRYVLVPTADLERVLGPLGAVRDFGADDVRRTLRARLKLDLLVVGKVGQGMPTGHSASHWFQRIDVAARLEVSTHARTPAPSGIADWILEKLHRLRITLGGLLGPVRGDDDDGAGRPDAPPVACLLPWTGGDGRRGKLHTRFEEYFAGAFGNDGWPRIVPPDKVARVLRGFPAGERLSAAARTALRSKFKADFLLVGTLDGTDGDTFKYNLEAVRVGDGARRWITSGTGAGAALRRTAARAADAVARSPAGLRDFLLWDDDKDHPAGDTPVLSKQVWAILVPPFEAADASAATMAREARAAVLAEAGRDASLRVVDFARAQALFPGLTSAGKLTQDMRRVLRERLGVDFIVHGQLATGDPSAGGAWKLTYLVILGHSGKPFHAEQYAADAAGLARGVVGRFATMRTKQAELAAARGNRRDAHWLKFYDEETADLRRGDAWRAPGGNKAGTLVEVPAHRYGYKHYLHRPPDYGTTGYAYPLVVFLHGVSSKSDVLVPSMFPTSPLAPLAAWRGGLPGYDRARLAALDPRIKGSFVLVPQVPAGDAGWDAGRVFELILETVKAYPVDLKRIYVMGISMGGTGSWRVGSFMARRLAALVPMCGANPFAIDPLSVFFSVPDIAAVPTWAFHAFDDDILEVGHTAVVVDLVLPGMLFPGDRNILLDYPHRNGNSALAADGTYSYRWSGGKIGPWTKGALPPGKGLSFTLYPSGKHDAWTATYGNPAFWEWLYAQRRE